MPFNQTQRTHGFIPYGSDDPDVVEFASFADADNVGSALIDTSVAVFHDDGMQVTATQTNTNVAGRIRYVSAFTAQFANGGHVSFDMTPEIFDDATVEGFNAIILNIEGTGAVHLRKETNTNWARAGGTADPDQLRLNNTEMPAKVRVCLSWKGAGLYFYVDGVLCKKFTWSNGVMPLFASNVDIFSQNRAFQVTKSRISNVQWVKRPVMLPVHPSAINIGVIGDSQTKNMQHPLTKFEILGEQTEPYGDSTIKSVTTYKNRAGIPVMVGELAKKGIHVGGIHWNGRGSTQAYSGATFPLSERTDSLLAGEGGTDYPVPGQRSNTQVLVCLVGTNDVASSVSDANFESSYKAEIDRWVADGIGKIILVNIFN